MEKTRILHFFGAMNRGGAETMLMNIYRNIDLNKIQFDFYVFNRTPGAYDEEIKRNGGKIYYGKSLGEGGVLNFAFQILKVLKEQGPFDIVHSHMDWQGGFIALVARFAGVKKVIVHSHAAEEFYRKSKKYKLILWVSKVLIALFATDYFACTPKAAKALFMKKSKIIANAIELDQYENLTVKDAVKWRKTNFISEKALLLGQVGNFSINKNQSFSLEVLYNLKKRGDNVKLLFVGSGETINQVKTETKRLNLTEDVFFLGMRDDIPEIMNAIDVLLLPSMSEGLGIVGIEAQAAGTPCVISDTIPAEIDMDLNLVKRVSLQDINIWCDEIINLKNGKVSNKEKIYTKLTDNGYNIKNSVKRMEDIYLSI